MRLNAQNARQKPTYPHLLLRPAEAALAMGISQRKLFSLTKEGVIPTVKLPNTDCVLYSVEKLREIIAENLEEGVKV